MRLSWGSICTDHGYLITSAIGKAFQVLWRDGSLVVVYPYTRFSRFQAGLGTFDHCACYTSDLAIVKARFMSIAGVIMWCDCFTFLCFVLTSNRVYSLLACLSLCFIHFLGIPILSFLLAWGFSICGIGFCHLCFMLLDVEYPTVSRLRLFVFIMSLMPKKSKSVSSY